MIRAYYNRCYQATVFKSDNDEFMITDRWNIDAELDVIKLYSQTRFMTLEEMLNDSIDKWVEFEHPWDAYGKVPHRLKKDAQAVLPLSWMESHYPQAYEAFKQLLTKFEDWNTMRALRIENGPDKDDVVNITDSQDRVVWNGSVYQRKKNTLYYCRTW